MHMTPLRDWDVTGAPHMTENSLIIIQGFLVKSSAMRLGYHADIKVSVKEQLPAAKHGEAVCIEC